MISSLWENIFKKVQEQRSIIHILSNNLLFKNLSLKELRFLKKIVHSRHYHARETIFKQGEIGIGMYIIAHGTVNITVQKTRSNASEKESLITQLKENDFFGELALVENKGARMATATAAEDTYLIGFFKPDLLELLERQPSLGAKIIFQLAEILGHRLKETSNSISNLKKEIEALSNLEGKSKNEFPS